MKVIKFFLIIVLVLTCIGGGAYYVLLHAQPGQFSPQLASLQTLQPLFRDGLTNAAQNLPDMSQIGGVVTSKVLGSQTEIKKDGTSAPQQAFEYARYTYCQQVMKDYQQRYSTNAGTSQESTPTIEPSPSVVSPSVSGK